MPLDFAALRKANVARCEASYREVEDWSPAEWAVAFMGEAGEVCNALKDLHVFDEGRRSPKLPATREEAVRRIGKEIADAVSYLDLLAKSLGIDMGEATREKFNEVSDRIGSDIKL